MKVSFAFPAEHKFINSKNSRTFLVIKSPIIDGLKCAYKLILCQLLKLESLARALLWSDEHGLWL